jgi:hypothetical protein
MRSLVRTLILACVLAMLLPPSMAYADDPSTFYTSTDGTTDGTGVSNDPRLATSPEELNAACQYFGTLIGDDEIATLYWILSAGGTVNHFQYNLDSSGTCTQVGGLRAGPPPGGVALTPPIIVASLIILGLLAMGVAWLLRRRLRA